MSDTHKPSKLFTHKPKKSQRSSGGPPQTVASSATVASTPSSSNGSSSADVKTPVEVAGSRGVSTSSGSPSPPVGTVQPFWYRFRTAIAALLVVNVAIFGYALLNNKQTSRVSEEVQPDEKEAVQIDDDKQEVAPLTEVKAGTTSPEHLIPKVVSSEIPTIPQEQQRELYNWMLTELRKAKPVNAAEKVHIDKQKEVLKQFIRKKEMPTL